MENPFSPEEISTQEALQKVEQLSAAAADFAGQEQEKQNLGQLKYAGFWMRWVANFIDGLITSLAGGIIGMVLGIALGVGGALGLAGNRTMASALGWLVGVIVSWIYYVYFTHTRHATLGKMLLGMEVRSADKEEGYVSLNKIILRETVGKFLSMLTLGLGYLLVAFTARKQGLHDFVGLTVVVYKDPQAKKSRWVIGAVVAAAFFVVLLIGGAVASVVLVSLSNARQKAADAAIKSSLAGEYARAVVYADEKNTFAGFEPKKTDIPACEYVPEIKVSADGSRAIIFAELCAKESKYACVDDKGYSTAGKEILAEGVISCAGEKEELREAEQAAASLGQKEASAEEVDRFLAELDPKLRSLDEATAPSLLIVAEQARQYAQKSGSYKGFIPSDPYLLNEPECTNQLQVDVSPDGQKMVIHRPLCSMEGISFCLEEADAEPILVETEMVRKAYKCR